MIISRTQDISSGEAIAALEKYSFAYSESHMKRPASPAFVKMNKMNLFFARERYYESASTSSVSLQVINFHPRLQFFVFAGLSTFDLRGELRVKVPSGETDVADFKLDSDRVAVSFESGVYTCTNSAKILFVELSYFGHDFLFS